MKQGELDYYRAVEDQFARLRGTPFLFSPKDFGLLQQWWNESVPLAAVFAGLSEVSERRRERGDGPVSSLWYCRHAVTRHARRLAEASVGGGRVEDAEVDVAAALGHAVDAVRSAAERWHEEPDVAGALRALADTVEGIPATASPAVVDETLTRLETSFLEGVLDGLPEALRARVDGEVEAGLTGLTASPEVVERTRRALSLRAVRSLLGVPRLELTGG